ncbi:MAG: hypothetical protein JRJ47_05020 [Deltaproteobacteria bacterium]|nr:hypothetical protein [Deltaproteobacteria bacterium]
MKTIIAVLLTLTLAVPVFAQASSCDKPAAKEKWIRVNIDATVENINAEKREITLKGPEGNMVTVTASEAVKRFDEIKVGDTIQAEYLTFLRAEFREPTAEEKANPLVVVADAGRAPKEMDPAGAVGAVVKAVVTVVSIDTEGKRVAIQGPRGNFMILPVEDEAVLNNLKVGEIVIMTYAEAVALLLKKDTETKKGK